MKLQSNEELVILPDAASAARAGADVVTQLLAQVNGSAGVALAGGRTPAAMYRLLTEPPLRECVEWSSIEWFWSDERCVPPDHPESNFRMARETLLDPLGVDPGRVHRMPADAPDLGRAALTCEQEIRRSVPAGPGRVPVLDLILLGIGADGHTASLFPGSAGLAERHRLVVAHHVPSLGLPRMTMTYPLLWAARHIVFLACGDDKAEAMKRVLEAEPSTLTETRAGDGDPPALDNAPPAAAVRVARGQIIWILDTAAARLLPDG